MGVSQGKALGDAVGGAGGPPASTSGGPMHFSLGPVWGRSWGRFLGKHAAQLVQPAQSSQLWTAQLWTEVFI